MVYFCNYFSHTNFFILQSNHGRFQWPKINHPKLSLFGPILEDNLIQFKSPIVFNGQSILIFFCLVLSGLVHNYTWFGCFINKTDGLVGFDLHCPSWDKFWPWWPVGITRMGHIDSWKITCEKCSEICTALVCFFLPVEHRSYNRVFKISTMQCLTYCTWQLNVKTSWGK